MGAPFNPTNVHPLDTDQSGISLKKINLLLADGIRIDAGDINIGGVEIQDSSSSQRATVNSIGGLRIEDNARQYTASSNAAVATASGAAILVTLTAGQKLNFWNQGTNPIKLKKGSTATTNDYTFILAGGTSNDDGNGAAVEINDWVGTISVFGDSAIRYKYTVSS